METSVPDRLRRLYALQEIDLHLDELEAQKGDLPAQVNELGAKVAELSSQIEQLQNTITNAIIERDKADVDIITLMEKIEKHKNQQFQVRSNREYDALTKEIEHSQTNIVKLEKAMGEHEGRMKIAKEDVEKLKSELAELEKQLAEKRGELEEVAELNRDEELKLHHEREKILVRVQKGDIALYERIRKAKGGKAVVAVRRGACGGCFNRIPPQRILELRQNSVLFRCEHCGRILVSDEIVNTSSAVL